MKSGGLIPFINREGLFTSRIVSRHAILSWNDFNRDVEEQALFIAREWPEGSYIGLWGTNTVEYLTTLFAVMRAGCVAVPMNTRLTSRELQQLSTHVELSGIFTAKDFPASSRAALSGLSVWPMAYTSEAGDFTLKDRALNPTLTCLLMYSSGTEGMPKAVPFTFRTLQRHACAVNTHLEVTPNDNWLACLPFFHVGGLAIVFRCLTAGASLTLLESADPDEINSLIESREITYVSVVPTLLEKILDRRGGRPYPSSLRGIVTGGGPVPYSLIDRSDRVLPTYGLTESGSMLTCARPESSRRERLTAGTCLPNTVIEIRDGDGRPVKRGEVGEIVARGPGISGSYLRDPERTRRTFREGWLHTGDLGYLDSDGCLHVLSRRTDLIISGGENIYPAEVESALREHPQIAQAVVLPVADSHWGQIPAAAIVLEKGSRVSATELTNFLAERIARYKIPKRWVFVSELPLLENGKCDLGVVRKLLHESE